MSTIYQNCWNREKCVIINGERLCTNAEVCVRLFIDNDRHKVELTVAGKSVEYDLLDTCYPPFTVGPASLVACTNQIVSSEGHIRSLRLMVRLCIDAGLQLPLPAQQCWTLIDTVLRFIYLSADDLRDAIGNQYDLDVALPSELLGGDKEIPIATENQGKEKNLLAVFGAKVLNNYPEKVTCWTGEPTASTGNEHFFVVAGDGGVSPDGVDVDHVRDPTGQWWKCGEDLTGVRIVVIERSGEVVQAKCKTSGPNKDCGE